MKFTTENQKENKVTWTTTQTVKHVIYGNTEVNITGMKGMHSVWLKQGKRMSQKVNGLNLSEAINFANNLINNI